MSGTAERMIAAETRAGVADAVREGAQGARAALEAADLAEAGRIDEAATGMRAALREADDLRLLFLGFQFFFRAGDLAEAERLTERRVRLAESRGDLAALSRACTNLGLIHMTTGRRDSARPLLERAVELAERVAIPEGVARAVGNLANWHEEAGELETAEAMNRRALGIARANGLEEMAAGRVANLGDIASAHGDHSAALALWDEAARAFTRLGAKKYAAQYAGKIAALRARQSAGSAPAAGGGEAEQGQHTNR